MESLPIFLRAGRDGSKSKAISRRSLRRGPFLLFSSFAPVQLPERNLILHFLDLAHTERGRSFADWKCRKWWRQLTFGLGKEKGQEEGEEEREVQVAKRRGKGRGLLNPEEREGEKRI